MKKTVIILLIAFSTASLKAQMVSRRLMSNSQYPFSSGGSILQGISPSFDNPAFSSFAYFSYKAPVYLPGEAMLHQTLLSNFQMPDTVISYLKNNSNRLVYSDGSVNGNYLFQFGIALNTKGRALQSRLLGCFQLLPFDAVTKLNYKVVFVKDVGDGKNPQQPAIIVEMPDAIKLAVEQSLDKAVEKLGTFIPATEAGVVIASHKLVVLPFNF
jgi:hypothetical protein